MKTRCLFCRKEFNVFPYIIKKGKGKFCSVECCLEWKRKNRVITKCLNCNKEIKIFPSRAKDGKGKFCSKNCYAEWQSKNRVGNKSYGWGGGKVKKECVICRKEFFITPSIKDKRLTCSRKCLGIWHSRNIRCERVGTWKGGINPLIVQTRGCYKYRQWRSDVFTRDGFTCQKCGLKGTRLQAHHIKSFASIIEEYNIKTFEEAEGCDKLWDINNGITLCKECHYENYK
jgi:5-methylcytosine-specific restriction endonuclease McrA